MKSDIGPYAKNWPSIFGAPNSTSSGHVRSRLFQLKLSVHKIGSASWCKGVWANFSL